jgi:hypothetical protein
MRIPALLVMLVGALGCAPPPTVDKDVPDEVYLDSEPGKADSPIIPGSVAAVASSGCSTSVVLGLAQQIVDQLNCDSPGALTKFDAGDGITMEVEVLPYLNAGAVQALQAAAREVSGGINLTSGYRTVAQQYLLYRWDVNGRCGITLAAKPGASNHEDGRGIDVSNYSAARRALKAEGWSRPSPSDDPVHFDYLAAPDLSGADVRAFQKLWNRNHPDDEITVDGIYGTEVASRLKSAPAAGFSLGPDC